MKLKKQFYRQMPDGTYRKVLNGLQSNIKYHFNDDNRTMTLIK